MQDPLRIGFCYSTHTRSPASVDSAEFVNKEKELNEPEWEEELIKVNLVAKWIVLWESHC